MNRVLLSFLATTALAVTFGNAFSACRFPSLYLAPYARHLSYVRTDIKTPKDAKSAGLFWLSDDAGRGLALDLSNSPQHLNFLYPGYGESLVSSSSPLQRFFLYDFEPTVPWTVEDPLGRLGYNVTVPWLGCFDLYKQFGADVIIFGSSEVYKAIKPLTLQTALKSDAELYPLKVLSCGTGSMPVSTVAAAIEKLSTLRPGRIPVVIWGYSYWAAHRIVMDGIASSKKEAIDSYGDTIESKTPSPPKSLIHIKGSDLFPALNWNSMIPLSYSVLENPDIDLRHGITIPIEISENETALQEYVSTNYSPFYIVLKDATTKACDSTLAEKDLQQTVAALSAVADRTFIYLTPTTPFHHRAGPPCLRPMVKTILEKQRQKNVYVKTDEMPSYGLTLSDFVRPGFDQQRPYFDANHVNHNGAEKVTQTLAKWIKQTEESR